MAIKRVTLELDDLDDLRSITNTPLLKPIVGKGFKHDQTKSFEDYNDAEISKSDNFQTSKSTVGRTIADLVIEFKSDNRVMSTLLVAISFLMFITKLDSVNNFIYPILLSIILNLVWYFMPFIEKLLKKKNK